MNFLKKLLGISKAEENRPIENFIVATLNDKVMPIDRGEIYGDPLDEMLQLEGIGEVTGGGTMQHASGEIEYCDLEICINTDSLNDRQIKMIIDKLESNGAPKGSVLTIEKTGEKLPFGLKEGLALYIDGVNLEDEVYKNCDSNFVVEEIKRLIKDNSELVRYWQGEKETGLYFYGDSFDSMYKSIEPFINEYPLCKGARVVKIA